MGEEKWKLVAKNALFQARSPSQGDWKGSFHVGGLKVTFLGDLEVAVRLGMKSWSADVGLSTSDSHFGPVVSF